MPRVLILHTGGTLGMRGDPLAPGDYLDGLTREVPEIARLADVETRVVCNLDSSDVGPEEWCKLARTIAAERTDWDGFVIVHGTDTMAYTASALAFALEGLDRPVVLTGAQRPLAAVRTDARRNLADAVDIATRPIPEVTICFDGLLLRGCRAHKRHMHDYRGFDSPGCEPLARLGIDVRTAPHVRTAAAPFVAHTALEPRVLCIQVTPGLPADAVDAAIQSGSVRGVVLVAFGVGTVPDEKAAHALAPRIERWTREGVDVLVLTQSGGWVDLPLYRNSERLALAGAIPGGSMTLEAGTTKLMHALGRFTDPGTRRAWLQRNVAGELG